VITNPLANQLRRVAKAPVTRWATAAVLSLACAALLAACGRAVASPKPPTFTVAGTVRDDVVAADAPYIPPPTPDLTVGISKSRLPSPPGLGSGVMTDTTRPKAQIPNATNSVLTTTVSGSRVSGLLASVSVRTGDSVKRGQKIAQLDDTLLKLGVKQAQANATAARAQVAVIDATISDLKDKRSTARAARSKVRSALSTIATGKTKLAAASAQLATGKASALGTQRQLLQARAQLEAGIAALSAQIAQLEGVPQPPQSTIAQLKAKRAALERQLAQVKAVLAQVNAGVAKLAAGAKTIAANSAKLAAGRAQARSGLAAVNNAISKIDDAISKLEGARTVAVAAIGIRDQTVATAKDRVAQAVISAPASGVVVEAAHAGETVMVGAPVATIRRSGPSRIDTWVTLAQLPLARTGTSATVTADSLHGRELRAVVKTTSVEYAFPPSSFPTKETHLLRTVQVTLALDAPGSLLPPGTPVDVVFTASP
jgi:HlyD family secretion protein